MFRSMGVCFALLCLASIVETSEGAIVGESLQWAETTVLGLLKHWGSHHRLDTMNHDDRQRMWDCGCKANSTGFFHPILVTYGTGIGTSCVRAPDEDKPNWGPQCGASCSNHEGKRTAHFCPPGLRSDCIKGCVLDAKDDDSSRIEALEHAVIGILKQEHAAVVVDEDRAWKCGCAYAKEEPHYATFTLTFGSGVGRACWREPRSKKPGWQDSCAPLCAEGGNGNREMVTFCPPGMAASCDKACTFNTEVPLEARSKALVRVIRDLAAHEGLARFRKPHYPDMHACGCNHAVELQHVKYGDAVGFVCERDAADKKPGYDADKCGPVCSNEAGKQLIHFCPVGYLPTCKGCSPQAEFDEL